MPNPTNKVLLTKLLDIFKRDYHSPAKVLIWGKAFSEWWRFGVGGAAFFIICLIFFVPAFIGLRQKRIAMDYAGLTVASHMNETATFIGIGMKSMEKREEILKELMTAVNASSNQALDRKAIEQRLIVLSSLLESCKEARGRFVRAFSEAKNPLLDPEISESLEKLTDDEAHFPGDKKSKIITPQEENGAWGNLCFLCENEIKRIQAEFHAISN